MSTRVPLPTGGQLRGAELRALVLERYSSRCVWCGSPLEASCTLEHLIPRARGGTSLLANLAPAHEKCNHRRGTITVSEWVYLCQRRGQRPNVSALTAALYELAVSALSDKTRIGAGRELAHLKRTPTKPTRWLLVGSRTRPHVAMWGWA